MPVWLIIVLPIASIIWMFSIEYRKQKFEDENKVTPGEQREEYYRYLDNLSDSGVSMFGAVPYLRAAYNLNNDVAIDILSGWMILRLNNKREMGA